MTRPKILIVDDELDFLKRARRNIKEFEVETASTIPDALQLIGNGGIKLIVTDIKLRGQERGYEIFELLFRNGEAIPVILITGYDLTDDDVKHFKSLGAVEILSKAGEKGPLSKAIERAATRIFKDKNSMFVLFEKKIWQEDLQNKNMTYAGSTKKISEWVEIVKSENNPNERARMLKELALVCNRHGRHRDSSDYVFPHF